LVKWTPQSGKGIGRWSLRTNYFDYKLNKLKKFISKFEVFLDTAGEHRWRLKANNGEIVATSEGYTRRSSAIQSAQNVKHWSGSASIIEIN